MHGSDDMGMMMPMTFHFSTEATILFDGVTTTGGASFALACVIIVVAGILQRYVMYVRSELQRARRSKVLRDGDIKLPLLASTGSKPASSLLAPQFTLHAIAQRTPLAAALLYIIHGFLAASLMLITMTFNVGLILAVLLGECIGFFVFSSAASERKARAMLRAVSVAHDGGAPGGASSAGGVPSTAAKELAAAAADSSDEEYEDCCT